MGTDPIDLPYRNGLPCLARPDARLLILGSFPGLLSLDRQQYYGNPRNQFWQLLGGAVGHDLVALDYDARVERLGELGIALWDVIARARRKGSLDGNLRECERADVAGLVVGMPALRAVAFNGAAAARIGRRTIEPGTPTIELPSSSPANTMEPTRKLAIWKVLARYL